MEEDALRRGLEAAAVLFNRGEYYAAHEALDGLWEATTGPDSDFLKGLIQACVAMHHYADGNVDGARKLYSGHRRYLAGYLPEHRGIDVASFLASMQGTLQPVARARPGSEPPFDPDDPEQRPRLEFVASS